MEEMEKEGRRRRILVAGKREKRLDLRSFVGSFSLEQWNNGCKIGGEDVYLLVNIHWKRR